MAVSLPDLTGDATTIGSKSGVPGGTQTSQQVVVAQAQPTAPQKTVQQLWRPQSFLDFHTRLTTSPTQAAFSLDQALQRTYDNQANLQSQLACRQSGSATVTGSVKNIPTGLATIRQCSGSIDNGATAHNFWVSVVKSQTPGAVDIFVWQPTSSANNTPVAGTTAVVVRWSADGSLT